MNKNGNPDFEIALVLAGAVSAGAYTAGVIDYLLDALEKWNEAKESGADVPKHNVRIKVIAGASAGGMTAAMTAVEIRRRATKQRRDGKSVFYEAWVEKIDIKRLLDTNDLENDSNDEVWNGKRKPVLSLLNSSVIDEIADEILKVEKGPWRRLPYVTEPLKMYLTLSNLRGIPYKFDLAGESGFPYEMTSHADYQYLEIGRETSNKEWDKLKQAAIATGAFPIGLSARIIRRTKDEYKERLKKDGIVVSDLMQVGQDDEPNFDFVAVDGGLLNNEPLELAKAALYARERNQSDNTPQSLTAQEEINDEILRILAKQRRLIVEDLPDDPALAKALDHLKELKGKSMRKAIIMVDPFPNISPHTSGPESDDLALHNILLPLFSAMRSQAMFKPEELLQGTSKDILDRFLIAPIRHRKSDPGVIEEHPIASGFFGGFGGFLSRDFRKHDYYLGRRNCQEFLMRYFTIAERFVRTNKAFEGTISEKFFLSSSQPPERINEEDSEEVTYTKVDPGKMYPIIPVIDDIPEPTDDWPIYKQDEYDSFRRYLAIRISFIIGRPFRWSFTSKLLKVTIAFSIVGFIALRSHHISSCADSTSDSANYCGHEFIIFEHFAFTIADAVLIGLSVLSTLILLFIYLIKVWLYQKISKWVADYLVKFGIQIK